LVVSVPSTASFAWSAVHGAALQPTIADKQARDDLLIVLASHRLRPLFVVLLRFNGSTAKLHI
jgi:hypothetical protein